MLGAIYLRGLTRDKMAGIRAILGELLDQVSASEQSVKEQLNDIRSRWLADRKTQGYYDWCTYFVKYPEMREGKSGRYVGWEGKLGYRVCMLEGERVSGYYRDPYLLAIYKASGVEEEAVIDPWFTGYEDKPRWLELKRSGTGLRSVEDGIALRAPEADSARDSFSSVCEEHGVTTDMLLKVPQVEINGVLIDKEDRVELGAELLQKLVEAGL